MFNADETDRVLRVHLREYPLAIVDQHGHIHPFRIVESGAVAEEHLGKSHREVQSMETAKLLLRDPCRLRFIGLFRNLLPILEGGLSHLLILGDGLGGNQIAERCGAADCRVGISRCLAGGGDVLQRRIVDIGEPPQGSSRAAEQALSID